MDDTRFSALDEGLWAGNAAHDRDLIDDACLMVLRTEPFVMTSAQSFKAVSDTPQWSSVDISDRQISRPEAGLIVVAYKAAARRDEGDDDIAYCTSTYRRLSHENWRPIRHQQTPPLCSGMKATG